MKQYMRIFRKETEDRTRYWVSVSADKTDKKGNATGEYVSANLTAYLSEDAAERLMRSASRPRTMTFAPRG